MTLPGPGSVTRALTRSLVVGLSLLWLAGVVGSGFVLKRLIDDKSDDELMESAAIMMSLVRHTDDLLVAAAVLGEVRTPHPHGAVHERFVYQVRDASGRVLLHSHNAPPELAQAAVFALVSLEENSPMGIEEAMAARVPVLTSNRCGMPYMVRHGETGFLVDPLDVADVARRLETLLADAPRRAAMGTAAREVALARFHPQAVARRTLEVYREIVTAARD